MLKAMIYVLMGCWDMGVGGGVRPLAGGISNRRQIGLTTESYAQCFRPLIGGVSFLIHQKLL